IKMPANEGSVCNKHTGTATVMNKDDCIGDQSAFTLIVCVNTIGHKKKNGRKSGYPQDPNGVLYPGIPHNALVGTENQKKDDIYRKNNLYCAGQPLGADIRQAKVKSQQKRKQHGNCT